MLDPRKNHDNRWTGCLWACRRFWQTLCNSLEALQEGTWPGTNLPLAGATRHSYWPSLVIWSSSIVASNCKAPDQVVGNMGRNMAFLGDVDYKVSQSNANRKKQQHECVSQCTGKFTCYRSVAMKLRAHREVITQCFLKPLDMFVFMCVGVCVCFSVCVLCSSPGRTCLLKWASLILRPYG